MNTAVAVFAFVTWLAGPAEAPTFTLAGAVGGSRSVSVEDLRKLTVRDVSVTDPHSKKPSRYRGVALFELLGLVGAPVGESLRGKALAAHVQIEAVDGYRAAFSLAELDSRVGSTDALVAFELDGKPLGGELGGFRIVVPTDKRGARWVRQVSSIRLVEP